MNNSNPEMFIKYIKKYGFDKDKSKQFLELHSNPKNSISMILNKNQFLLSDSVNDDLLNEYNIKGACGHFSKEGIFISDNNIEIPKLKNFDVIIGNGYSIEYLDLFTNKNARHINKYIGFASDGNAKMEITNFVRLIKILNNKYINKYELVIGNIEDTTCGIITKRK